MTQEQRRAIRVVRYGGSREVVTVLDIIDDQQRRLNAVIEATHDDRYMHGDCETAFNDIRDDIRRIATGDTEPAVCRTCNGTGKVIAESIGPGPSGSVNCPDCTTGDTEPEDDDPFGPVTEAELEAAKVKLDNAPLIPPRIKPGSVEAAHARIDELAARVELNFTLGQGRYATLERHIADPKAHRHTHEQRTPPALGNGRTGPPEPEEA